MHSMMHLEVQYYSAALNVQMKKIEKQTQLWQ